MVASLPSCGGLRSLNLSDNTFGVEVGQRLAAALAALPQLTSLNMDDTQIRDAGTDAVLAALAAHGTPLVELRLGYNELTADGVRPSLAPCLEALPGLEVLSFHGNVELKNRGARAVARGGVGSVKCNTASNELMLL